MRHQPRVGVGAHGLLADRETAGQHPDSGDKIIQPVGGGPDLGGGLGMGLGFEFRSAAAVV